MLMRSKHARMLSSSLSPSKQAGALVGSLLVGLIGVLPLFIIPLADSHKLNDAMPRNLRMLLGLACGGLLGDVFLHILPEVDHC